MIISQVILKFINFLSFFSKKNKNNDINVKTEDIEIINEKKDYILIPSVLDGFVNKTTTSGTDKYGRKSMFINGTVNIDDEDYICDQCGCKMHLNNSRNESLKHLSFGGDLTYICFKRHQLFCEHCHYSKMQKIKFKNKNHFITNELYQYIKDLLSTNNYTLVEISELTGVGRNIIKEIDLERLKEKYTVNGDGKELIKPEKPARFLGIDEFKLHNGFKYATHIIDIETGHILWIAEGKGKQVVLDFINHVGLEWMKKVEAITCDMNAGFEKGFIEKCPHIKIVFDHFHIIKNFNEYVVNNIYKEVQAELRREEKYEEANSLKKSKYILFSSRKTLKKKDNEAGKVIKNGSDLFKTPEVVRKSGYETKYNNLINDNKLLFTVDLVKEQLKDAYSSKNSKEMEIKIIEIIEICKETGNKNFNKFAKLLERHIDGIITYADYGISSGKIEGINNRIKTLRRQHYGLPDDTYFFLKLFDMSRTKKSRKKSH